MRHFNLSIFIMLFILGLMNNDPTLSTDLKGEKELEYESGAPQRNTSYSAPQPSCSAPQPPSLEEQIKIQVLQHYQNLIPTGTISAYAGIAEPTGWLFCHGQALSRLTFSNLYQALGTTYGLGDGTSTFNIPDLKGRVIVGVDNAIGRVTAQNSLGDSAGEENVSIGINNLPSHSFAINLNSVSASNTGIAQRTVFTPHDATPFPRWEWSTNLINTQSLGGDQPHNNMQPYLILNYIIKY